MEAYTFYDLTNPKNTLPKVIDIIDTVFGTKCDRQELQCKVPELIISVSTPEIKKRAEMVKELVALNYPTVVCSVLHPQPGQLPISDASARPKADDNTPAKT